jgi:hypothetical protein
MTLNITLDMNCIIGLESEEVATTCLREIVAFHNIKKINIKIPGISAAEKLSNGGKLKSFLDFKKRIDKLSIRKFTILRPFAIWDMTYFDYCIFPDDEMIEFDKKIQKIIFPQIPICLPSDYQENKIIKWKNARCDVVSMWCHIYYSGDIFVTSDRHFLKEKVKNDLQKIGSKNILSPTETLEFIKNNI